MSSKQWQTRNTGGKSSTWLIGDVVIIIIIFIIIIIVIIIIIFIIIMTKIIINIFTFLNITMVILKARIPQS